MNKAQKEVQQAQLNDEKKVIKLLELVYEQAKKDCEQKSGNCQQGQTLKICKASYTKRISADYG